jgi:S1-C subfamily serine protease
MQSLWIALVLLLGAGAETTLGDIRDSMVKIYAVQIEPYYYDPWSMNRSTFTSGSGCIIDGNRILTNAHIVSDQSFVQVRRHGEARKHTARVLAVSHAADLALLTVEDSQFFQGIAPLPIGALPEAQQQVAVYGFPEGGDTLSITRGVVSRIEHDAYAHSSINLLAVQIDAAINSGNSGGPVISDQRISGVVMQYLQDSENIGYMVPAPLINHFLTDLQDGRYDGIPEDGLIVQEMENASLKRRYGMNSNRSGILVAGVIVGAPAGGVVRPGDIILKIDGHAVADDGTVAFRHRERTDAGYYTQTHQIGERLNLTLLRRGKEQSVSFRLDTAVGELDLVPRERYDVRPTYFIYGGLIFIPLTQNYLMSWGENWYNNAPKHLVALHKYGRRKVENEQVVILSKVLPAEVNKGYHDYRDFKIVAVNGKPIFHIRGMIAEIEGVGQRTFIEFQTEQGIQIVLNRQAVEKANPKILKTYSVPDDRSEDLR